MILMEEGGSYAIWPGSECIDIDEIDGGAADDVILDLDMIYSVLENPEDPCQSSQDDVPNENPTVESATAVGNQNNFQHQNGSQTFHGAHALDSEFVDTARFFRPDNLNTRNGSSTSSFDYAGSSGITSDKVKLDTSSQINYPVTTYSGSFNEWVPPVTRDQGQKMDGLLQSEIPNSSCSTTSSFTEGETNNVSNVTGDLDFNNFLSDTGIHLSHAAVNSDCIDVSHGLYMDSLNGKFGCGATLSQNSFRSSGHENDLLRSTDMYFEDIDVSSHNVAATQPTAYHYSDVNNELGVHPSAVQLDSNSGTAYFTHSSPCYLSGDFSFGLLPSNEGRDFQSESASSAYEYPMIDYCDDKVLNFKSKGISSGSRNFLSNAYDRLCNDKLVGVSSSYIQSDVSKKQPVKEDDAMAADWVSCRSMMHHSDEASKQVLSREVSSVDESSLFVDEVSKQSPSGVFSAVPSQKDVVYINEEKGDSNVAFVRSQVNGISEKFTLNGAYLNSVSSEHYLLSAKAPHVNKQMNSINQVQDSKLNQPKRLGHLSRASPESIQSSMTGSKSHIDDDLDICIIEDNSRPASLYQSPAFGKGNASLLHSPYGDSIQYTGVGNARPKVNDESIIFRAALQDLSQPKSEASPPEGVLAVPLLRHQRIALSWMVQKETSSLYCSGGILADDQGLGKTVSTIALILKERPPSGKADVQVVKKEECETLDLDEDVNEVSPINEDVKSCLLMSNCDPSKKKNTFGQSKGRPAAGTLVVCPTSVLRQWADELHNKVTSTANLSVLVYHGSNRTKDPCELAKYDVVLTTYSIVSMEVPKQPLIDEDDSDKGKAEGDDVASLGLSSGKKRKYPPSSGKKGSRNKKGLDATLLESVTRPLAKVAWFRVVLDEAQSIKNHRTQVARACWGLRAKRRWCLSGTPIQNAIDDLYSYFRFLRYDPYDVYNLFCSSIKIPIQKSPTKGYRKLQAVLKTVMLRRTKGTQIDGKPIINLPPKVIELKKVDFTDEERDFYTQLENDSRAQFREYAAAGTVKQNYVNILWMLLRLRQACDHPLLVRDINSNSFGRSSMEMAKKLPQGKQMCLLHCLETSLAICGICNDPPEDAVVSICGHVFCNQCICEHLTGDDNLCPTSKCKIRLNTSLVFTKATLKSSLSDQPAQDGAGYDLGGEASPYSEGLPYDSSKIRAAIEVLQSLNKPKDCRSGNGSLEKFFDGIAACPENVHNTLNSVDGNTDTTNMQEGENINGSVQLVGEKAIVFSQWTRMLDLLEACLKSSSVQYRRLDGTMSVVARDKAVKDFNTLPEVTVMIMSLKAASLGLNMVAACRVLLLDLWWNPTTEDQAIDRAHRIGQTRPVTVLRLTVKDTVEDRILALQQKKREMVASAFGEDETGGRQTRLTVDDLKYLFMV